MGGSEPAAALLSLDEQGAEVIRATPDDRRGFALVLVLLALLVLAAIASAAFAAALGQLRAAGMAGRVLATQTAAAASVEEAIQVTRGRTTAVVGGGAQEILLDTMAGGGTRRVFDLRVSPEFHLLLGEAAFDGGVPARYATVVWWMDPEARVGAHRAVLEASTVQVAQGARIRTDLIMSGLPGVPGCAHSATLARSFGRSGSLVEGPLPGPPEWGAGSGAPGLGGVQLGRFDAAALDGLASARLTAAGRVAPACPACWSGLVHGTGAVRLIEAGAGVLVVDGDLVLAGGASWTGLLLVAGDLTVADGSRVTGLLRAGGTLTVAAGAAVNGSACAALEAFNRATSLFRPRPLPGRASAGPVPPAGGGD